MDEVDGLRELVSKLRLEIDQLTREVENLTAQIESARIRVCDISGVEIGMSDGKNTP